MRDQSDTAVFETLDRTDAGELIKNRARRYIPTVAPHELAECGTTAFYR
ncbi:MAG: hypothetical protein GTO41_25775 [Burkholderiales bacterium]|nr:hypothetical protein [Burkholderiales bacterium]